MATWNIFDQVVKIIETRLRKIGFVLWGDFMVIVRTYWMTLKGTSMRVPFALRLPKTSYKL